MRNKSHMHAVEVIGDQVARRAVRRARGFGSLQRRIDKAGEGGRHLVLTDVAIRRYCEYMKNITVSLDDETYRRARMIAAQRDTSVSALVKRFLLELASGETETERLKREERALRERITAFRASDRLSRDDLHNRRGA